MAMQAHHDIDLLKVSEGATNMLHLQEARWQNHPTVLERLQLLLHIRITAASLLPIRCITAASLLHICITAAYPHHCCLSAASLLHHCCIKVAQVHAQCCLIFP
jgi:hypothetical protein